MSATPQTVKRVALRVNGRDVELDVAARRTLAELLREDLGLTGTKVGCNRAECGSCTVIVDDRAVFACTMLGVEMGGRHVRTVEGLARDGELHPLQTAFIEHDAVQCGICIPGMLMALTALLDTTHAPSVDQVNHAVAGNLCRCGTYPNTVKATLAAARALRERDADIAPAKEAR